jgi:hypothetical protein
MYCSLSQDTVKETFHLYHMYTHTYRKATTGIGTWNRIRSKKNEMKSLSGFVPYKAF